MTAFDYIYYIGSGVAFLMGTIGLYNANKYLPEEEQCFGAVVLGVFIFAILSWAVPICWFGYEIYKRLGEK